MLQIERLQKYGRSFLERDIMLSQIDSSFIWVPLKFHAKIQLALFLHQQVYQALRETPCTVKTSLKVAQ